jgi:hypothetical protein
MPDDTGMATMQTHIDRTWTSDPSRRLWSLVGFLIYVAVGVVFLVGGLLFVPGYWLVPLWGGWLVGLFVAYRLMQQRSWWTFVAAPLALAVLWAYLEAGWAMWGWAVEDLPLGGR